MQGLHSSNELVRWLPTPDLTAADAQVRPGQSSDARSGYATADAEPVALTPVLGGGQTPLTGARKVEAMLGIAPGGAGSMPPPAPRRK